MFVGHFAIAFLPWRLFPQVPLPVSLIAVSFPDLLWSFLVPAGVEKVRINLDSPLQKFIVFEKYPYSHSFVLANVWSLLVGLLIAWLLNNPLVALLFVAGSVSHWLLDTVVHMKDLQVLGFDGDRKVGAGLWRRGPLAFVMEYAFYALVIARGSFTGSTSPRSSGPQRRTASNPPTATPFSHYSDLEHSH